MSEHRYHNKQWTVLDFDRYYTGKMQGAERHALERAALDDPFLQDSLDGYLYSPSSEKDLQEIRNRLAEKRKKQVLAWYENKFTLLKVAAILIVFFGITWVLNKTTKENGEKKASLSQAKPATSSLNLDTSTSVRVDSGLAFSATKPQQSEFESSKIVPRQEPAPVSTMEHENAAAPVIAKQEEGIKFLRDSDSTKDITLTETRELFSREKSASAPSTLNKAIEGKINGVVIRNQNDIRGRVVDHAGNPVAFANINDRLNNRVLAADKDGYFALSNNQNAPKVPVDVNAVGFETNNTALDAKAKENKVVLTESNQALSEVVVTGSGTRRKQSPSVAMQSAKSVTGQVTLINAIPVNGWNSFNRYLSDSLQRNPLYDTSLKNKTLQLFVEIDQAGRAKNIESKFPVADSVLHAAERLLQSFPPIKKIKKSKKAEVIMRLR